MKRSFFSLALLGCLFGYISVAYATEGWKSANAWGNYLKSPMDSDCQNNSCAREYSHVLTWGNGGSVTCNFHWFYGGNVYLDGYLFVDGGNWWGGNWQYQTTKTGLCAYGCLSCSYCARCETISPSCSAGRFSSWCQW